MAAGDLGQARDRLERALGTIEEERDRQTEDLFRWSYMEDKHQVNCSYVDLLERQEGAGPCFAVTEQAHASALLHLLGDGEGRAIDADEARRRLLPAQGDLLLEYRLGEDGSFLRVLDSSDVLLPRVPPRHGS